LETSEGTPQFGSLDCFSGKDPFCVCIYSLSQYTRTILRIFHPNFADF